MSNLSKKIGSLLLAGISVVIFASCGKSNNEGSDLPDDIEVSEWTDESVNGTLGIRVWKGGFGTLWLENVAAGFKKHYPNVSISVKPSEERKQVYSEIVSGLETKYDVFFSEALVKEQTDYLIDLSEVYDFQWEGEDRKISEKINPTMIDACTVNVKPYMVPSYAGGMYGIVYNTQWIEDFPVTTDGLLELCETLKGNSVTPIVFGQADYWNYAYSIWFAQYEGVQTVLNAQIGRNTEGKIDPTVAYLEGGLKSMQTVEDFLWYENKNIAADSTGLQFIIAQRQFLKEEKAAMMCNGSWMMNEMYRHLDGNYDFKMAKFPVISSIKEKCTTIADDKELTALINAIDNGQTALSGEGYEVNQADFDKIKEARSLIYSSGEAATGVITKASKNQELAKLFLKYLYSDEGIKLMAQSQCGATLPVVGYDFSKELGDMDAKTESFLTSSYNIIFNSTVFLNNASAAVTPYYSTNGSTYEILFGSKNSADRVRAAQLYEQRKTLWSANNYSKFYEEMNRAGLSVTD